MPRYLIERRLPDAGKLDHETLRAISQKSNGVLADMRGAGKNIQWVQSYVTDDAIHCVYIAESSDDLLEHARCGGFPADSVMEVRAVIDPITGA
ncbi:MAG TPA: DUF4242 domain-containing protein [Thermomicrobiales bacterium]|nr:DUF4242 domain-containing protein [Thermomicrobiales bacterium]